MFGFLKKKLKDAVDKFTKKAEEVVDVLYDGKGWKYFSGHKIPGKSPRGTGCRFAASLATALGKGENIILAIEVAREYLRKYIEGSNTQEAVDV